MSNDIAYTFTTETGAHYTVKDGTIQRKQGKHPVLVHPKNGDAAERLLAGEAVPISEIIFTEEGGAVIVFRETFSGVTGKPFSIITSRVVSRSNT